jgi:acid phosphatase
MLAGLRLDQALADKSWTALPGEQADGYQDLPPAVILDIDETVLDNSEYQAWTVKSGNNFSSKTWTPFVNSVTSRAIPGSLEFIKQAQSKGVAIFYISNRKDHEEKATIENLKKFGYPVDDAGETVLTRGEKEEWKASAKSPRRKAVGATHRVLLNIGDNLGDFTDESDGTPEERQAFFQKTQDMWGKQWIMIANPTYGSWEGASFGFQWKLSDGEKRQMKLDKMDAWKGPE